MRLYQAPPAEPEPPEVTDREHAIAARVELLVALVRSPSPSRLKKARWEKLLSRFKPQYRRVIILHGLMGMPMIEVGERIGVGRGRPGQIWGRVRDEVKYLIDLEDV